MKNNKVGAIFQWLWIKIVKTLSVSLDSLAIIDAFSKMKQIAKLLTDLLKKGSFNRVNKLINSQTLKGHMCSAITGQGAYYILKQSFIRRFTQKVGL
jgi:CTP-dependent riboflavin kinase